MFIKWSLILLFLLWVIAAPLLVIWSLNILFLLSIPYNIYTWVAVVLLTTIIRGDGIKLKKQE